MNSYPEIIIDQQKIKKSFSHFFNYWNWELHLTFSFHRHVNSRLAFKEVKRWLKKKRHRFRKIKFGALIIYSNPNYDNPHAHMVAVSDPRYPRRLTDISPKLLRFIELSWELNPFNNRKKYWEDRTCRITTNEQWSNKTLCNYVSKPKNIPLLKPDQWDIDVYRAPLLEVLRNR